MDPEATEEDTVESDAEPVPLEEVEEEEDEFQDDEDDEDQDEVSLTKEENTEEYGETKDDYEEEPEDKFREKDEFPKEKEDLDEKKEELKEELGKGEEEKEGKVDQLAKDVVKTSTVGPLKKKKRGSRDTRPSKAKEEVEPEASIRIDSESDIRSSISSGPSFRSKDRSSRRRRRMDVHIARVKLPKEVQVELKCEYMVDISVDIPWALVPRTAIWDNIRRLKTASPFYGHQQELRKYRQEEVLLGYDTMNDEKDLYFLTLSLEGRNMILEELKSLHKEGMDNMKKTFYIFAGPWESLGSENEIGLDDVVTHRPLISFEWTSQVSKHEDFNSNFEVVEAGTNVHNYCSILFNPQFPTDNVTGEYIHKLCQAGYTVESKEVQTVPEIPFNDACQFTPEIRAQENDEILKTLEIDMNALNEWSKKALEKFDKVLQYNAEYDLYSDDYQALALAGEDLIIFPNAPYKHYLSFAGLSLTEGKVITSYAWHPTLSGVLAVAYGEKSVFKMGELHSNSDDSDYVINSDDSENELYEQFALTSRSDQSLAERWSIQAKKLEQQLGTKENDELYRLAIASIMFLNYSKDIRKFEMIQEKKRMINLPDIKDLETRDTFNYKFFYERVKKKDEKDSVDVTSLLLEEEIRIKNDYLNPKFQWNFFPPPAHDPDISESNVENIKTYKRRLDYNSRRMLFFNVIWAGESWKFGDPLKDYAKDVNMRFRLAAFAALGRPRMPDDTLFLPGYSRRIDRKLRQSNKLNAHLAVELDKDREHKRKKKRCKKIFKQISSESESEDDDQDILVQLRLCYPIFIWSFADDLKPLLRLESPSEVHSLSFCPHDGSLLVGGTVTGQLALWDLRDKLGNRSNALAKPSCEVNMPQELSAAGSETKLLKRIMSWQRKRGVSRNIRAAALSDQKSSHFDRVISIFWLPPSKEIDPEKGQYRGSQNEFSLQFLSTSVDGSMKFWDCRSIPRPEVQPKFRDNAINRINKYEKPSSLFIEKSEYDELNQRWDPIYNMRCALQNAIVNLCITAISHYPYKLKYSRVTGSYKSINEKEIVEYKYCREETEEVEPTAYIGTLTGDLILINWTGEINKDTGVEDIKLKFLQSFHDGPITSIDRHPQSPDLLLTAGGHLFAIWSLGRDEPIKWKRYFGVFITCAAWSTAVAGMFRVGRSDGTVEVWDLFEQDHEPKIDITASGYILTGLTSPKFPTSREVVGVVDYKGTLRFFWIPWTYKHSTPADYERFFKMIDENIERKKSLEKWAEEWRATHKKKKRLTVRDAVRKMSVDVSDDKADKKKRKKEKKEPGITECEGFKEELYKWYLRRRGRNAVWLDESEQIWYEEEQRFMIKKILANKNISLPKLLAETKPLYEKQKKEMQTKVKIKELLSQADSIFQEHVLQLTDRGEKEVSHISVHKREIEVVNLKEAMEETALYFGEFYKKIEDELEEYVKNKKIVKRLKYNELLEKCMEVRRLFNDRRQFFDPQHNWLLKLIKKTLEKNGLLYGEWESRMDRYPAKKYERRLQLLPILKKVYGEDYDPFWDLHGGVTKMKDRIALKASPGPKTVFPPGFRLEDEDEEEAKEEVKEDVKEEDEEEDDKGKREGEEGEDEEKEEEQVKEGEEKEEELKEVKEEELKEEKSKSEGDGHEEKMEEEGAIDSSMKASQSDLSLKSESFADSELKLMTEMKDIIYFLPKEFQPEKEVEVHIPEGSYYAVTSDGKVGEIKSKGVTYSEKLFLNLMVRKGIVDPSYYVSDMKSESELSELPDVGSDDYDIGRKKSTEESKVSKKRSTADRLSSTLLPRPPRVSEDKQIETKEAEKPSERETRVRSSADRTSTRQEGPEGERSEAKESSETPQNPETTEEEEMKESQIKSKESRKTSETAPRKSDATDETKITKARSSTDKTISMVPTEQDKEEGRKSRVSEGRPSKVGEVTEEEGRSLMKARDESIRSSVRFEDDILMREEEKRDVAEEIEEEVEEEEESGDSSRGEPSLTSVDIENADELIEAVMEMKRKNKYIKDEDELSNSYVTIIASIPSTTSSPNMSLLSFDAEESDVSFELDESEMVYKEYFEGPPPRQDPPITKPYIDTEENEPTEEWMEDKEILPPPQTEEEELERERLAKEKQERIQVLLSRAEEWNEQDEREDEEDRKKVEVRSDSETPSSSATPKTDDENMRLVPLPVHWDTDDEQST